MPFIMLISYILAMVLIYQWWDPDGFLGFIGALFVGGFLAIPIHIIIVLVLGGLLGITSKK